MRIMANKTSNLFIKIDQDSTSHHITVQFAFLDFDFVVNKLIIESDRVVSLHMFGVCGVWVLNVYNVWQVQVNGILYAVHSH